MRGLNWLSPLSEELLGLLGRRVQRRRRISSTFREASTLEARVLLSSTPAGGEFPVDVTTGTHGGVGLSNRYVAMAGDGSFVAAWSAYDDEYGSDVTYIQRFNSSGTPLGSASIVTNYPFGANNIGAIAMNDDGAFVVVWQRNYQLDGIFVRRFDATGTAVGNEIRIDSASPTSSGTPDISAAMDSDGKFIVTWGEGHIRSQMFDAQGGLLGTTADLGVGVQPSVAMTPEGSSVVTWTSADGSGNGIFGQRLNVSGAVVGSAFRVNEVLEGNQSDSSVAINPDGSFIVSWTSAGQDGDGDGVFARRYEADGDAIAAEFQVNSTTSQSQYSSSVASAGNAGFIVSWTSIGQDGLDREIFAQWYDSEGTAIDGELLVNSYTEGVQWHSSVAMAPNGAAVIVWGSAPQEGRTSGVYGQRFERDNIAPTDLSLDGNTVIEGGPAGTLVGTLSATDPDAGETFTYSLVAGTGDSGNAGFVIVGNELQTATDFDFETLPSHSIRIRVTDSLGATFEKVFMIQVADGFFSELTLSNQSVEENRAKRTLVGSFDVNDAPSGTLRYSLVNGVGASGNRSFAIVGNQLRTRSSFNFEAQSSYSIRVRVAGAAGFEQIKVFTIAVTDVDEAPVRLRLSSNTVNVGSAVGTSIGDFGAVDVDANAALTYSLVSGNGDRDNGLFLIDGTTLKTNTDSAFERRARYSIRVRVTDDSGNSSERTFRIRVIHRSAAPFGGLLENWLSSRIHSPMFLPSLGLRGR